MLLTAVGLGTQDREVNMYSDSIDARYFKRRFGVRKYSRVTGRKQCREVGGIRANGGIWLESRNISLSRQP